MLNKIYKNYELNKKYGIRKLSIGIASVSLGLFAVYNANLIPELNIVDVVKADENLSKVIYTNSNPTDTIDNNSTSNNSISKIIELTPEKEDQKKFRVYFGDDLNISNKIVFNTEGAITNGLNSSNITFNNEIVGTLNTGYNINDDKVFNPEKFNSFEDYFNYIKENKNPTKGSKIEIKLNDNFKKYTKNRYIEFELSVSNKSINFQYETETEKVNQLKAYKKPIENSIVLPNGSKYSLDNTYLNFILGKTPSKENESEIGRLRESSYINGIRNNIPNYLYEIDGVFDKYTMSSQVLYKRNKDSEFGKTIIEKGTKIEEIITPQNIFKVKDSLKIGDVDYLKATFYRNSSESYKEIWSGDVFRTNKNSESNNSNITEYIPLKVIEKTENKIVYEVQEDVKSKGNIDFITKNNSLELKNNFIDLIGKQKYLDFLNGAEKKLNTPETSKIIVKDKNNNELFSSITLSSSLIKQDNNIGYGEFAKGTIKVKYLNENNKEIKDLETIVNNEKWDKEFTITPPNINGYVYVSSNSPLKDIVGNTERTIILYYKTDNSEKTREIPFSTTYKENPLKNKGETDTEIEGINGIEAYKENDPDYSKIIKNKINKVVLVGTKPKVETIIIPPAKKYIKDNTKDKGLPNEEIQGKNGSSSTITTYEVNPKTGEITETKGNPVIVSPTDTIIKVPAKDKIEVTTIPSPKKYIKDSTREKGSDNIVENGKPGSKTITTSYDVNPENGNITENVGNPVIVNPTETIIKVPAKTKVELIKNEGKTIEKTTDYNVNPENGNITETVTEKIVSDNNPENPPVVNELPEFNGGVNPIDSPVLDIPEYTGPLSTNTPVDDNGNLILPPVVDDLPEYNGGVNPIDSPVLDVPEYTSPISTNTPVDENGNLILPPVVDELPEFNGGVNPIDSPVLDVPEYTGPISTNTPVDDNGNLILPPVVDELPEFNGGVNPIEPPVEEKPEYKLTEKPKEESVKESPKEETKAEDKKEKELPNTNSTSILTTLVSSIIGTLALGYKSKRRK